MSGTTTLATVQGARKTLDLQLPAEVPTQELLPMLLVALGMVSNDAPQARATVWGLGRVDARTPFTATATLLEMGVHDGEQLIVQDMAIWQRRYDQVPAFQQVVAEMQFTWRAGKPWDV